MLAKYIIAALAAVFLVIAVLRILGTGAAAHPQVRAWLMLGAIFGAASAWLFYSGS